METPRLLRSFMFVMVGLVLLMIINILTSANHLHKTVVLVESVIHYNEYNKSSIDLSKLGPQKPTTTAKPMTNAKPKTTNTAKSSSRPDDCTGCFSHDFKYLLQNETICKSPTTSTIDLLIVILTVHSHVKERNNIRATWLTQAKGNTANVRYTFLLGRIKDQLLMKSVEREHSQYGDILMEDFVDSYSNLTYKTIMGMKWASLFCSQAQYFMKTDDDMWVNVPEILKWLKTKGSKLQSRVGGRCAITAGPIRNRRSKWYASIKSYPNKSYPGFCSGTGYITSMNVARKIYELSPNVPFFHLEDIYVALCVRKLHMTLFNIDGFCNWRTALNPCEMRSSKILTSHQVPTDFLHKVMNATCVDKPKQIRNQSHANETTLRS